MEKGKSLLEYLLLSMIPYSKQNIDLMTNRHELLKIALDEYGAKENSFYVTMNRAKKNGYLEEVEIKGQKNLHLTMKGRIKILKSQFKNKKEKWDEKWRIIIFDIPEQQRKSRDFLRSVLRDLGFKKYQLSVWVCPYDRTKELMEIINEFKLQKYIQYFIAESISNEKALKEKFGLAKTT